MLVLSKPSKQVSGLPFMDEDLSVLSLVADTLRQSAVVLMRVGEDDATNVRKSHSMLSELLSQHLRSNIRFWPNVDESDRVLTDEVYVYVAYIERSRDSDRNDLHLNVLEQPRSQRAKRGVKPASPLLVRVSKWLGFACLISGIKLQSSKQNLNKSKLLKKLPSSYR